MQRAERRALAVVIAVAIATAVWRAVLVTLGPDPDSDAYGHHIIARILLANPTDHGAHWVWLPLFHWLQVPLVALGGTMQHVRFVNVALWALVPLVLFGYLTPRTRPETACLAAVFAALCPIGMQMGTTAQLEPLFALVVLGFAFAFEKRRFVAAAALATAAVLLRYEAWAVVAATCAVLVLRRDRYAKKAWLSVVLPAGAILGWALIRWPIDGRFFGFVSGTREFASDVLHATSSFQLGPAAVVRDSLKYVCVVAFRVFGPTIVLAPLGVWRLGRRHPWLAVSGGALLAFITLVWLLRGTLGLDRHFVSVIPVYASAMALGGEKLAEKIADDLSRRRIAFAAVAAVGVAFVGSILLVWMAHWRGSIEGGYRDRRAVAAFVRDLPAGVAIFCDEATVEVLTGLGHERFKRRPIDRRGTRDKIAAAVQSGNDVYVISWLSKLEPYLASGELVFRPEGAKKGEGLGVLRLTRPVASPTVKP